MTEPGPLPDGIVRRDSPGGQLFATERVVDAVREAGLDDPDRWEVLLAATGRSAPGRGSTATLELASGSTILLKRMRRGGLAGPIWRDRYAGIGRLLDNMRIPLEARRRGIATPEPLALLAVRGPGALTRGWLATEWIEGARDLASRYTSGEPPELEELAAAMALVRRMHDAGVEHRDLNLGNLMLREGTYENGVRPNPMVIDLDRARLHASGLSFQLRQRALRRLERSYVKILGERAQAGAVGYGPWYELYAAGDPELLARLKQGRGMGRFLLALHRLTWRRRP